MMPTIYGNETGITRINSTIGVGDELRCRRRPGSLRGGLIFLQSAYKPGLFCLLALLLLTPAVPAVLVAQQTQPDTQVEEPAPEAGELSEVERIAQRDALALYNRGRYAEAVEVCLAEIELQPNSRNSYAVLSWSLIALGRYQEALTHLQRAMRFARGDHRLIQARGEANYYLERNEEALNWFQEYVHQAPNGPRVARTYYFMGDIFLRLGEYNRADIALTKAVTLSADNARWWLALGQAREQAELAEPAESAYLRALELNQNLAEAAAGLERVRARL